MVESVKAKKLGHLLTDPSPREGSAKPSASDGPA